MPPQIQGVMSYLNVLYLAQVAPASPTKTNASGPLDTLIFHANSLRYRPQGMRKTSLQLKRPHPNSDPVTLL